MKQPHRTSVANDARSLAWHILQEVEAGGYADALLGLALGKSRMDPRDQALATQLVYGTIAWQGYLDHLLAGFAMRPPGALDPPVRAALRLALFQVCILTKIPPFAAVDTAVNLVKSHRGGSATGFVNAVLRRAVEGWRGVPIPAHDVNPVGNLSVRLSHPRWLVERWVASWGVDETEALLRANNEPAPTVLRANVRVTDAGALTQRLAASGITASRTSYSPCGITLHDAGNPECLPGYDAGEFSVQGEASQLVGFLVAPRPGDRVLDACAAPGGKTIHLAEIMDDRGEIIALDPRAAGVERLHQHTKRLRLGSIRAIVADAMKWQDDGGGFDSVLIDAPCSGLGTLRQHPEIRWRRSAGDVAQLAALQGRLLAHLGHLVRAGGALIYATCTLTPEENEGVIFAFLSMHPEFSMSDPRALLPPNARGLIAADHTLRTLPHRHALDGFFAVRLQRRNPRDIVPR